jgi:surfactin synthase thioesterase subunit
LGGGLEAQELRPARSVGQVYLFRGIFSIDGGISVLRDQILRRGIPAAAYDFDQWGGLTAAIANARRAGQSGPVILIGYSLGGQSAVDLSYALGQAGIPVDLLVTLDAPDPLPVPGNVRQALNLYQTRAGPHGRPLVVEASFRGQLVNRSLDMLPGISHDDLVRRPEVLSLVLPQVLQTLRR